MTAELPCCLAPPQDLPPSLPAASRPAKAAFHQPSTAQGQSRHTSCPARAIPGLSSMLHTGEVRTSVPDSKETGTARDTRSRGEKEHSKKVLAIHSFPPGQTLASAAALRRNQGIQFSLLGSCPGQWGHRAASYQSAGLWPSLLPLQKPHSASWVEWRPGLQGASMHSAPSPATDTRGFPGVPLPASLKPRLTGFPYGAVHAAWAWINAKGPQMKQTSAAVFPSFLHTQFFQVLFFCFNRRERTEPL